MTDMRAFITRVLRDLEGNAVLSLANGRSAPTAAAPNGKLIVDRHHWFAYPAELDMMVEFAENALELGQNAYISPIIYGDAPFVDGKGNVIPRTRLGRPLYARSRSNALMSQTIYMDSDECPPEAFRMAPSMHVQTSEGHGHDYWYLATPVPAQLAAEVAHKITTAHRDEGSDPSGWSANKLLRLPTVNTSYDEDNPFEIQWYESAEAAAGEVYDVWDIAGAYDDIDVDSTDYSDGPIGPVPPLEGLPDHEELLQRIPHTQRRLNDLIYKTPRSGPGGWRSEQRWALLLDLQRFGFTDEETISIAWHAPAAAKWREDKRGVEGLWWELQARVKPILANERGDNIPAAPAPKERSELGPKLLTAAQRQRVEERSDLLTLYLEYAKSKVQTPNMPYHIINGWTLLSLGLSEAIEHPRDPRPLGTGIYSFTIGRSSTGKDESKAILSACVRELYMTDSVEIPAATSREKLVENLIQRSDKVTYIQDNEADALLAQIKAGGYSGGLFQYWTRAYDGEVPSLGRVGRDELNKPDAHAIPVMHFMGTPVGILKTIDRDMFHSGYLARQIWVLGQEVETTEEMFRTKVPRGERAFTYDGMPAYFASRLRSLRSRFSARAPLDKKRVAIDPTDEALEMVDRAKWKIYKHVEREQDIELWRPIVNRFGDILWKIATLQAASEGRTVLGTRDVEVALYYGEMWLENAFEVSERISDTFFSRQCDEIERFIAASKDQTADTGAIYRFRKGEPPRVTSEYLQSLVSQGRIHESRDNHYSIKRARKTA